MFIEFRMTFSLLRFSITFSFQIQLDFQLFFFVSECVYVLMCVPSVCVHLRQNEIATLLIQYALTSIQIRVSWAK